MNNVSQKLLLCVMLVLTQPLWAGCESSIVEGSHTALKKKDAKIGAWRHAPRIHGKDQGAQIDLMFDLHDSIMLCEIKYCDKLFTISKEYSNKLINKINVFNIQNVIKIQLIYHK